MPLQRLLDGRLLCVVGSAGYKHRRPVRMLRLLVQGPDTAGMGLVGAAVLGSPCKSMNLQPGRPEAWVPLVSAGHPAERVWVQVQGLRTSLRPASGQSRLLASWQSEGWLTMSTASSSLPLPSSRSARAVLATFFNLHTKKPARKHSLRQGCLQHCGHIRHHSLLLLYATLFSSHTKEPAHIQSCGAPVHPAPGSSAW